MYILITAFEPFGGNATNITQEILRLLPESIGQHTISKKVLPVSFLRAPTVLRQIIQQMQPNFVLMLGQCKENPSIRLEQNAHNIMNSRMGDNDGYCPTNEIIYADAPDVLTSTMNQPLGELCHSCHLFGWDVSVSDSAGQYVCNRVYYEALYFGQESLFVHFPKNVDIVMAVKMITFLVQNLYISK